MAGPLSSGGPMSIEHMDPFATTSSLSEPEDDPERITGGRYRLPDLTFSQGEPITGTGPRKYGWMRVTTLVKAIAEARALDLWHQRELLKGLAAREDLYDLVCATVSTVKDPGDLRAALEDLATKILLAAGTDSGANRGTAFHGFAEAQDQGLMHFARRKWHGRLTNYSSGLAAHRLQVIPEYIERRVVILEYGAAGTLDRVLLDQTSGLLVIGDLKTQKSFWTWLEIAAQLAAYARADAMWDRSAKRYVDMPEVSQEEAVVAWAPADHPEIPDSVDFFTVDLEKGRRALRVCQEAIQLRSEARSSKQTWGVLRPMPELSTVESYAARLETVETPAEGSALWAEITARGLHATPELRELADTVAVRLAGEIAPEEMVSA